MARKFDYGFQRIAVWLLTCSHDAGMNDDISGSEIDNFKNGGKIMALIRWQRQTDPFHALEGLQQEMNRLFRGRQLEAGSGALWAPAVDIYETKDDVVVHCELPGLKREDIHLSIRDNTLYLEGERRNTYEATEEAFYCTERWFGRFYRAIELPTLVDSEKVNATYEHGVLAVRMPKHAEVKPKEISIKGL